MTSKLRVVASLAMVLLSAPLHAEEGPPAALGPPVGEGEARPLRLSLPWDGAAVAVATAAVSLAPLLPVDTGAGWVLDGDFEPYDPRRNRTLLETVFKKLEGLGATPAIPTEVIRIMSDYPGTCRCRS